MPLVTIKSIYRLIDREMTDVATRIKPAGNQQASGMAAPGVTSGDAALAPATKYQYLWGMKLLQRDVNLVRGVAEFGSMTTDQIFALYFYGMARTTCTRRLNILVENGTLSKVPVRLSLRDTGAPLGCFQIGKNSWRSFYTSNYRQVRDQMKLVHTLAIVDTFVAIKQAERAGQIDILNYAVEYEAWINLAGSDIRPDMFVDLGLVERKERVVQWVEVDNSSERYKHIKEKLDRYRHAYNHSDKYPLDIFPQVVFLANTAERARELRQMVGRESMPDGFVVVELLESYPQPLL